MSVKNHWQKILRFCHQKLQQRISEHYLIIISINSDVAKELGLGPIITQLKSIKPALDQSALEVKIWGYVWTILQHICFLFDEFSNNIKKYKNILPVPLSLFWHLSKVVSISRDIKIFDESCKLTPSESFISPGLRDFQIINLKRSGDIPFYPAPYGASSLKILFDGATWPQKKRVMWSSKSRYSNTPQKCVRSHFETQISCVVNWISSATPSRALQNAS